MEKCEGQDVTNKRVLLATIVVSLSPNGGEIFYSNEYQFSFEKYSTNMKEAYSMLTHYHNVVPDQFRVQRMLDGTQVSNALIIDMDKAHVLENLLGDWLASVSYMSANVEIQFPPRSGGGSKCKGDRRISKFDSKRRRGGSRGRGRGQGCGSRSGHHYGSNWHDKVNGWFHGVDCSDFRRRFSGEDFYKNGSDGRIYVKKSARVTGTPTTFRRFSKGGKMMGRS